jgi:hypothetical protein
VCAFAPVCVCHYVLHPHRQQSSATQSTKPKPLDSNISPLEDVAGYAITALCILARDNAACKLVHFHVSLFFFFFFFLPLGIFKFPLLYLVVMSSHCVRTVIHGMPVSRVVLPHSLTSVLSLMLSLQFSSFSSFSSFFFFFSFFCSWCCCSCSSFLFPLRPSIHRRRYWRPVWVRGSCWPCSTHLNRMER